jgi:hypothetical protein
MTRGSSLLPIQLAMITALVDDGSLSVHIDGRVYDFVPENPTFPYVVIRTPTEVPWDMFHKMAQRVTFTFDIWSTYRGSKETKEIQAHINDVLDRAALSVSGYSHIWTHNTMSTDMRDVDGIHWHGVMKFETYVNQ